jgi:hypothetical protein
MEYKYQTVVKYAKKNLPETEFWFFKDTALDYYNDCGKYMKVEWKEIRETPNGL